MGIEWIYNGIIFDEESIGENIGFVYIITNTKNNKKYIGKKFFYFAKSKMVKGKKKKVKTSSNWKNYYGSNDVLIADVKKYGKEYFVREIVYLCKSKGECSYLELREQMDNRVLEIEDFYNNWIFCRIRKSHIKGLMK